MRTLTKKEVKELKKRINEESIINIGYYESLKNKLKYDEIIEVVEELNSYGTDLSKLTEWQQDNIIITEIVKNMNYQDFKRRIINSLIGYSEYQPN